MFFRPTLVADALALLQLRLDVDQFPDGILLGLRLGFVLCVCGQGGKNYLLVVVVTELFARMNFVLPEGR